MRMSIAIPTYEVKGRGVEFLNDLFRTIEIQTFKDFEVVVSDHSKDDKLVDVIDDFQYKFDIKYVKNKNDFGNGPANTNNAIKNCSGDIIKVMFQDDFFYDDEALQKIHDCFNDNYDWLVCGSNHTQDDGNTFYWDLYPKWNDNIIRGVNSISSPSVMAAKKKVFDQIKFDESLVMMMDCEIYYHIKKEFGEPIYLHDVLVSNRVHQDQISLRYNASPNSASDLDREVQYCISKHLE